MRNLERPSRAMKSIGLYRQSHRNPRNWACEVNIVDTVIRSHRANLSGTKSANNKAAPF